VTSGFRTFTAGEVLTASNVQNYLMDQSVMTFAGSAARSSAIGTANFEEGMTSYLKDTDKLEVYNGTNWVSVAPTTTQGLTLINTTSFSAVASQSVNTVFNSTYDNYLVTCFFESTTVDGMNFRLRLSGTDNSSSNYNYQELRAEGVNVVGARVTGASTYKLGVFENNNRNYFNLWLSNVAKAQNTIIISEFVRGEPSLYFEKGAHLVATAFDGFTLLPLSGNITGSVSIYGINK